MSEDLKNHLSIGRKLILRLNAHYNKTSTIDKDTVNQISELSGQLPQILGINPIAFKEIIEMVYGIPTFFYDCASRQINWFNILVVIQFHKRNDLIEAILNSKCGEEVGCRMFLENSAKIKTICGKK